MSQKNVPQDTIVPMYRISILVVVFCVFAGAIFCSFDSHHKKEVQLEALEAFHREASQKALIIFATRDVPPGGVIRLDDLKVEVLGAEKIPQGALSRSDIERVVGRKAKYGLNSGQIVNNYDLDPQLGEHLEMPDAPAIQSVKDDSLTGGDAFNDSAVLTPVGPQ